MKRRNNKKEKQRKEEYFPVFFKGKNIAVFGKRILFILCLLFAFCCCAAPLIYAQQEVISVIKFKDVGIKVVLQSIAAKAEKDGEKVNIIVSPNVEGLVTVKLENISWQEALDGIVGAYNYDYKWIGNNVILVGTLEEIKDKELREREMHEIEVPRTKVFKLSYLDANDAKKTIEPLLSAVGRISVLEATGQAGWEFGTDVTKRTRSKEGKISRTKTLVVSDVSSTLKDIALLLEEIDIRPQQILIKARIMEVSNDFLKDFGFSWGTGSDGASQSTLRFQEIDNNGRKTVAGHMLNSVTPNIWNPLEGTAFTPSTAGLQLAFQKLTGQQFEVILSAVEEDANTNTLSAPTIVTLNNQEASILVGEKYPIIKTDTSTETSRIVGGSLEEYKDIGIQLNVVPQICGKNSEFINMIVHPAVTSESGTVSVKADSDTVLVSYPIIASREAETQVLVKDGETIVIGGLMKDVKSKEEIGIPFLSRIPVLGWLFKRSTEDTLKMDLLIFITAKIIEPGEIISQEIVKTKQVTNQFKGK